MTHGDGPGHVWMYDGDGETGPLSDNPGPATRIALCAECAPSLNALVSDQLDLLLHHARAIAGGMKAAGDENERIALLREGRGTIWTSLTTLLNLRLLTSAEHDEWSERLSAELRRGR